MNINLARVDIAGESNTGPVRHHNEDHFLIFSPPGGKAVLAVIADGIGGHSRGEVASKVCCTEMLRAARQQPSEMWDTDFLRKTLQDINDRLFEFNFKGKRNKPMGCTVVAAVFFADKIIYASAGDSRLYEFHRQPGTKPLHQITTDHRPDGYEKLLQDNGIRHVSLVSRSVGTSVILEPDTGVLPRHENAKYLLCSDGLYHHLPEQLLTGILGSDLSPRQTVDRLIRNALLSGEKDNISVICAATLPMEK